MQASFSPGPVLTGGPQTGSDYASVINLRNISDGRAGNPPSGNNPNKLMIAGGEYSPRQDTPQGFIKRYFRSFCTEGSAGICNSDIGGINYAVGYTSFFRFPDQILAADKDIVMGGFTAIKTTLSNDYLVFGVGVSMAHQSLVRANVRRYQPVEFGSFVFGPRFPANTMPTSGLAAYAGFSQAYAQSSNLAFQPFYDAKTGGFLASGYSAMVFSFDSNGEASFEHGFIDLFGTAFVDDGTLDVIQATTPLVPGHGTRTNLTLSANFENPGYRSTSFVTAAISVDASSITEATGFTANPLNEFVTPTIDTDLSGGAGGEVFFRLNKNDQTTADTMDFTMELFSLAGIGLNIRCFNPSDSIACYASTRPDGSPAGAGVVQLYGAAVDLEDGANKADNVPTFAGGVWQYEGIVYVDLGDDDSRGGTGVDEDTLLGVVDLYGSFGGLVVDNPAE